MKKILFLITAPSAGGTETYLIRFLEYAKDIESTVLCKKSIHGELEQRYKAVTRLISVGNLGLINPMPYIKLVSFLRKNKYDAVCDFTGNFSGWVLLCAKLANMPIRIAFYRESRNQFKPTCLKRLYAKFLTQVTHYASTKILSNSYEALNYFYPHWEKEKENYTVIYNGLDMSELSVKSQADMRKSLHLPQDAFIVCHSGRYTDAKNHKMILECAKKLCDKYRDMIFILVGKDVQEKLGNVVEEYGLVDRVIMLGYRNDVLNVLKCADMFYFPSLNEGQPNALIEAMATGLPFVASDIPSIKETVPKDRMADLVDPNDLQANVSAIENLYNNRGRLDNYVCDKWVREHFEAPRLFNLFLSELI